MRVSWIVISVLLAKAHSYDFGHGVASDQQALGSFDDVRGAYQCNNGAIPSLECVDPSIQPACACTCTNGITFNQSLNIDAPSTPSNPDTNNNCDAITADCDERQRLAKADYDEREFRLKQELTDIEQKRINANNQVLACEKDLDKALKPKSYKYQGCYTATKRSLTALQITEEMLQPWRCAIICSDYSYYGVKSGNVCWCGNELQNSPTKVADSQCNTACIGNKILGNNHMKCGGKDKVAVYAREG